MSWSEFCTLLAGIMHDTPLGQVVGIRSESDKDMLKYFTPEQHRIRNEWRGRYAKKAAAMSTEEAEKQIRMIQDVFKRAFGK